ncbi:MAG TPA: hypothetical protein VFW78_02030 [Bacteroidia bacterium]|nr:hypothetical protein [Bacteroidia bacterium]
MKINKILLTVVLIWMGSAAEAQKRQQIGSMKTPFVFSQQFKHAVGLGATFYNVAGTPEPVYHIAYSPNLALTKGFSDFSVSVGSHITGGYHLSSGNDDSAFVYADLPLLLEFNIGHNASKDFYSDLGGFFGGGYSYNYFRGSWQQGPEMSLGMRTFIFGPSFTIRYTRFFAIREQDITTQAITISLNLGNYFEQVKKNNKISRFTNGGR